MSPKVGIVSLFPQMFAALDAGGVTARAIARGRLRYRVWNPRDFSTDRHRRVDDRPYGGGAGMVLQVEPVRGAIRAARRELGPETRVIHLTPQGDRLSQARVAELAGLEQVILLCGRYEGIDERLVGLEVDEELSIGDYVLSGGELAAMVVVDAMARLLPGVLGAPGSAEQESFSDGLLDHPHYTRPELVDGLRVPAVLLSGDHEAVRRWRLKQSLGRTWQRRADLLAAGELSEEQRRLLDEFKHESEGEG